jgi:hypothetical protein
MLGHRPQPGGTVAVGSVEVMDGRASTRLRIELPAAQS